MADYTITPEDVLPPTGDVGIAVAAGDAIPVGQWVAYDPEDSNRLALADTTDLPTVLGITVSASAAEGQPCCVAQQGEVTVGEIFLGAGYIVVLSDTAGGMKPVEDLANDEYVTILGYSTDTDKMMVQIINTGQQLVVPAP